MLTPQPAAPLTTRQPPTWLSAANEAFKRVVLAVQNYSLLAAASLVNLLTPPIYFQDIVAQVDVIGVGSLPIIVLTGFFIGAVLVLQTASQFARFGTTSLTADAVSIALIRELGPTITALLVAGRSSSGIASELGSMVVTEQVDAMRAMGIDPGRKLVTPRVVAAIVVLPLLTGVADFFGLLGGFAIAHLTLGLSGPEFWHRAVQAPDLNDLVQGLSKPIVFAFILSTVGCFKGLTVQGGTQGVGRATTSAVVIASVSILVVDFFLNKLLLFLLP